MKKYINAEEFVEFVGTLEKGKYTKLFTEDSDGDICEFAFLKTEFNSRDIVLYEGPYGEVCVIRYPPIVPYNEYPECKEIYEDFHDEEYKVFIEV